MALPTYKYNKYQADLTRVQSQIATLEAAVDSALANGEVEEYHFSSGEGRQSTVRRSLKELLEALDQLEAREMFLLKKLNCDGVKYMNVRRKQGQITK